MGLVLLNGNFGSVGGGNRTRKFVSEFRTLLNLVSIEESISAKKIENPEVTAFE